MGFQKLSQRRSIVEILIYYFRNKLLQTCIWKLVNRPTLFYISSVSKNFLTRCFQKVESIFGHFFTNIWWLLKEPLFWRFDSLSTKTVQSASLTFQSIHHVLSGNSLALGVLGIGNGITDHVLEENLENTSGFLVDQTWNTLDTTTAGKTTDCRLCDTLDVISQDFSVSLCASFSKTFSSFFFIYNFSILILPLWPQWLFILYYSCNCTCGGERL